MDVDGVGVAVNVVVGVVAVDEVVMVVDEGVEVVVVVVVVEVYILIKGKLCVIQWSNMVAIVAV